MVLVPSRSSFLDDSGSFRALVTAAAASCHEFRDLTRVVSLGLAVNEGLCLVPPLFGHSED